MIPICEGCEIRLEPRQERDCINDVNSVGDHVRRQLPHHHRLQILDPERFREVARYYENIEAGSFAICVSDDGRSVSDLVATAYDGFYVTEIDALTSDLDQAVCAANEFGQAVLAQS